MNHNARMIFQKLAGKEQKPKKSPGPDRPAPLDRKDDVTSTNYGGGKGDRNVGKPALGPKDTQTVTENYTGERVPAGAASALGPKDTQTVTENYTGERVPAGAASALNAKTDPVAPEGPSQANMALAGAGVGGALGLGGALGYNALRGPGRKPLSPRAVALLALLGGAGGAGVGAIAGRPKA